MCVCVSCPLKHVFDPSRIWLHGSVCIVCAFEKQDCVALYYEALLSSHAVLYSEAGVRAVSSTKANRRVRSCNSSQFSCCVLCIRSCSLKRGVVTSRVWFHGSFCNVCVCVCVCVFRVRGNLFVTNRVWLHGSECIVCAYEKTILRRFVPRRYFVVPCCLVFRSRPSGGFFQNI